MDTNVKKLVICLSIPLAGGGLATVAAGGTQSYAALNRPPLSPPGWVFPLVWTVLYLLMGYGCYRVLLSPAPGTDKKRALIFYGIQLGLNFLWPLVFFGLSLYWLAFVVLLALWAAIYLCMHFFGQLDDRAEDLLIPYLLWVTFAGYLNLGVALMN